MKKWLCTLLIPILLAAATLPASAVHLSQESMTADEAIAAYEVHTGETVATCRYYFQMPDGVHGRRDELGGVCESWYNEYSQGAGVYWWGDFPAACESWPGYRANVEDAEQGIWYVDMPAEVEVFFWNNRVDGGTDQLQPIYSQAAASPDVFCESAGPGEYDSMPEGCENMDHCIFVLTPDISTDVYYKWHSYGEWYFYYGDGCYGMYAKDSEHFTDIAHNCCNPDHFDAHGNHTGFAASLRGDYDWDNSITVMDATRVQNIIAVLFTGSNPAHIVNADTDNDKELTIMDATRIQLVVAELLVPTEYMMIVGDYDGDSILSIMDAARIRFFLAYEAA